VIIVQDKNEAKNAKNTARLLALSLKKIDIIQSDDTDAMQQLAAQCRQHPNSYTLFFPSPSSTPFEQAKLLLRGNELNITANQKNNITNLIFLDGTWRKAKKLYLSHDWLNQMPSLHFEEKGMGRYRIRKTSIENGLSTLEAVSYVLEKSEKLNVKPLQDLMDKMQSFWPPIKET
jgi:DTW domain-containing protein YfiP